MQAAATSRHGDMPMSVIDIVNKHVDAPPSNRAHFAFLEQLKIWRSKLAEQVKGVPSSPTLPPVRLLGLLTDFDVLICRALTGGRDALGPANLVEVVLEGIVQTAAARIENQFTMEWMRLHNKSGR